MEIKKGARIENLQPIFTLPLSRIDEIFQELGYLFTITSGTDGNHKTGSLHYQGLAIDIRTRHMTKTAAITITALITENLALLSPQYQVILETDHIHIEYERRINK